MRWLSAFLAAGLLFATMASAKSAPKHKAKPKPKPTPLVHQDPPMGFGWGQR